MTDAEIRLQCLAMCGGSLSVGMKLYDWVVTGRPYHDKPQIVAFTTAEGGEWRPFDPKTMAGPIFAIKTAQGEIYDPITGWR